VAIQYFFGCNCLNILSGTKRRGVHSIYFLLQLFEHLVSEVLLKRSGVHLFIFVTVVEHLVSGYS